MFSSLLSQVAPLALPEGMEPTALIADLVPIVVPSITAVGILGIGIAGVVAVFRAFKTAPAKAR